MDYMNLYSNMIKKREEDVGRWREEDVGRWKEGQEWYSDLKIKREEDVGRYGSSFKDEKRRRWKELNWHMSNIFIT